MLEKLKNGGETGEKTRRVEIWPGIWAYRTQSVVERVLPLGARGADESSDEDARSDDDARSNDDDAEEVLAAGAE